MEKDPSSLFVLHSSLSKDARALLLLTLYLGPQDRTQPLTTEEYNRLAAWLAHQGHRPAHLPEGKVDTLAICPIPAEKIQRLLGREEALSRQLEKWLSAGVTPIARTEKGYPPRLRQVLKKYAPPVLFYMGNPAILAAPSASLVGSRDIASAGEAFARQVGREAALQGLVLASGGAKGADFAALDGCLAAGGRALVYPAQGVGRFPVPQRWKAALLEQRLAVAAPFLPHAVWSVTNAVARNRLIYAHSPACFVAGCRQGQGGTWHGAAEALSRRLTRVLVRCDADAAEGNPGLIALGAEGVGDEGIAPAMQGLQGIPVQTKLARNL